MALSSHLKSWVKDFPHRISSIPWRKITNEAFDRCLLVTKFACFVHVTNNYLFGVALVHGPSMLPTLNMSGDVVLLDKLSHRLEKIDVGDVVLVRSPENPRKMVMKRVMGKEGDKVTFAVDPAMSDKIETVVVPKGHIWVQGDNIYSSRDSRQFGAVSYGLVLGRAFCRVWPVGYFGLLNREE